MLKEKCCTARRGPGAPPGLPTHSRREQTTPFPAPLPSSVKRGCNLSTTGSLGRAAEGYEKPGKAVQTQGSISHHSEVPGLLQPITDMKLLPKNSSSVQRIRSPKSLLCECHALPLKGKKPRSATRGDVPEEGHGLFPDLPPPPGDGSADEEHQEVCGRAAASERLR